MKTALNWMRIKNFQILEICIFRPLWDEFISEAVKDIGNMSTYYQKALNKIPSTTNKKKKKKHQNFDENKTSIYLLYNANLRNLCGFKTPFRNKIAKKMYGRSITQMGNFSQSAGNS